jgi:hypothetical protein
MTTRGATSAGEVNVTRARASGCPLLALVTRPAIDAVAWGAGSGVMVAGMIGEVVSVTVGAAAGGGDPELAHALPSVATMIQAAIPRSERDLQHMEIS